MEGELFQKIGFIADLHNSAKVWVTNTKYTILDRNLFGGFLHLRYKTISQ
jgi:hypothetical protein